MSQGVPNLQTEEAGIRVDKSRHDPTIAPMPMDEREAWLPHFPRLANDLFKYTIPDDLAWMISVEVNRQ